MGFRRGAEETQPVPSSHQDDLHIVDSLELPTTDPQYLMELAHTAAGATLSFL